MTSDAGPEQTAQGMQHPGPGDFIERHEGETESAYRDRVLSSFKVVLEKVRELTEGEQERAKPPKAGVVAGKPMARAGGLVDRLLEDDPELARVWQEQSPARELALGLVGLRRAAELSQKQLAEAVGWDQGYVSRLESGRGPVPEMATVQRYAKACGGSAGYMLVDRNGGAVIVIPAAPGVRIGGRANSMMARYTWGSFQTEEVPQGGELVPAMVKPEPIASRQDLTVRQLEVLRHLRAGLPNKMIAQKLHMSQATVKVYTRTIMKKLGVSTRAQLIAISSTRIRD